MDYSEEDIPSKAIMIASSVVAAFAAVALLGLSFFPK